MEDHEKKLHRQVLRNSTDGASGISVKFKDCLVREEGLRDASDPCTPTRYMCKCIPLLLHHLALRKLALLQSCCFENGVVA